MTASGFQVAKHVTAGIVAVAAAGLFVLGVDGVVGAMQKLSRVFVAAPPPPPAATAPPAEPATTPGVVPAFIVPAGGERE